MELTNLKIIRQLARQYNFRPSRKSGQNFLITKNILNEILAAAELKKNESVLEIGAGFGALTAALLKEGAQVTAVELDKRLANFLKANFSHQSRLKIIKGDIFQKWDWLNNEFEDLKYKLVANLPYNITSLVLRNFLEKKPRPNTMVVLVQKEVAIRVVAKPGNMSLLSVVVQFFGEPEIVKIVEPVNFWPQPEVDSAILLIKDIGQPETIFQKKLKEIEPKKFFKFVKMGFAAKRKQLHNNLSGGLGIASGKIQEILAFYGLNSKVRPQDLSIKDWINIMLKINRHGE